MSLTRSLADLENLVERDRSLSVRIERADGTSVEGQLLYAASTDLLLLSGATGEEVQVSVEEVRTIDACVPRRGREWLLAVCAIPAAIALLIGWARPPWVRPQQIDLTIGFLILAAIAAGFFRIPVVRTRLESWLTQWKRLYPISNAASD